MTLLLDPQHRAALAAVFAREAARAGHSARAAVVLQQMARDVIDGRGRLAVVDALAGVAGDVEAVFLLADFLDCGLASPAALAAWVAGRAEVADEHAVGVHSQNERVVR
jgi:hypothetical protein